MEGFQATGSDVVLLNLTRNGAEVFDESFSPAFTYSVFEEDTIIGYKNPRVKLSFSATDLEPRFRFTYSRKMQPMNDAMAQLMDVNAKFKDLLPETAWEEEPPQAKEGWSPPGERIHSYDNDGESFEVWSATLANRDAMNIMKNMKILIPLFIEGGTVDFLDDDGVPENQWTFDRWRLFLVYRVDKTEYTLAAFSTSYRNWVFPSEAIVDSLPSSAIVPTPDLSFDKAPAVKNALELPSRERISQFIVLPPFQHSCHGWQLYTAITGYFLEDSNVFEITVEEPNEHFDNLRDYCDLARLEQDEDFQALELPTGLPSELLTSKSPAPIGLILPEKAADALRKKYKIAPRQFSRVLEIHLLGKIPSYHRTITRITRKAASKDPYDRSYYFWRLLVKNRVYWRNQSALKDVPEGERISKLEDTVEFSQQQYEELLQGYAKRVASGLAAAVEEGNVSGDSEQPAPAPSNGTNGAAARKRPLIEDSDDDDEVESAPSKRQATEELLDRTPKVALKATLEEVDDVEG
jgi:histone acetyltransferase 1